tara:strand:+ start:1508 stop:3184 length:1677 start_codon:yes stop_codon:yes gene_type:complete
MISVSRKKWTNIQSDFRRVKKLSIDKQISLNLSNFFINRKFTNDEIFYSINLPKIENILSKNFDFITGYNLLKKIIDNKDLTLIFGDYDVDGITSTAILINFFKEINHPNYYILPDRFVDGYGPNLNLIKKKLKKSTKAVIFVDCGTNSNEVIDYLLKKNIKILVIDHHQINIDVSKKIVLINPMKNSKKYFNLNLSASTLTLILISMFKYLNIKFEKFLLLSLLGSMCDVMPMRSINRYIAKCAFDNFNKSINVGLRVLIENLNLKRKIDYKDLTFLIGPILNSAGRVSNANLSVELLILDNKKKILSTSKKLMFINNKRKEIENRNLKLIDTKKYDNNHNIIFEYNKNFHEGVIGILAGKLKEKFNRPAFVVTHSNNILKGSARSNSNFKLNKIISKLLNLKILEKGGGHEQAAGFTLKCKNLLLFKKILSDDYNKYKTNKVYYYDLKHQISFSKSNFINDLKLLEPFGSGNSEPLLLFENLKIIKTFIIKNKHIKNILKNQNGKQIHSIAFDAVNTDIGIYLMNYKKNINLVGHINEIIWNSKKFYQINIKDLII